MSTLKCFLVDDHDYYAAHDAEEASKLHCDIVGCDMDDLDDCIEVVGAMLDRPWHDEDDQKVVVGTLREWLAEATEPGWISGTE